MQKEYSQKEYDECYKPLFDLMFNAFGETPLISEMDDIRIAVEKVNENLNELLKETCDVQGCENTPTSGGSSWRDAGYWMLCDKHHGDGWIWGLPMPEMKPEAVRREASRGKDGVLTI